jgi:hypothetical protein
VYGGRDRISLAKPKSASLTIYDGVCFAGGVAGGVYTRRCCDCEVEFEDL